MYTVVLVAGNNQDMNSSFSSTRIHVLLLMIINALTKLIMVTFTIMNSTVYS